MRQRLPYFLLSIVFFGVLIAIRQLSLRHQTPVAVGLGASDALRRYGFHFDEVAAQSGINFVHQAPVLDPKIAAIMPQIASMGASVSIVDFDKDGWPDIYVGNSGVGSKNALCHNLKNGKFEDVAEKMGVADVNADGTGVTMGAVWGDYDNDGYEDLLLYKWGRPELFHNDAGAKFSRVTDKANLPPWVNANSATWLDYDNDGKLDLLICGYYPENVDLWHLKTTRFMTESFEYANNGGRKFLLRGNGDGTFEDVTQKMGLDSHRWTLAVLAADLRGTGYPDLILANDYGYTEIYANENGKKFRSAGQDMLYWNKLGPGPKSGMSASVGDIANQGQFALYISNLSAEGNLVQGNNLWMPHSGTSGKAVKYDNVATDAGVDLGGWSFGAQFADWNNDGNLDIFLTNGYISADKNKSYWYDYSKVTGGNAAIISDAKNWPPMRDMSLSGYEQKRVWLNDGFGKFTDVAPAVGVTQTEDGRAVACADLWNRGVADVVVANQKGPLRLYKNTVTPQNAWIEFALEGTRSNRSALGATATLFWKDAKGQTLTQKQQIAAASGFCAQNDHRLHFGLGPSPTLEKLEIRWPSGKMQTVTTLAPDKLYSLKEPL